MPNHCSNILKIKGKQEDLAKFKKLAAAISTEYDSITGKAKKEKTIMDFNKFIPYPKKYKDLDKAAAKYQREHPNAFDAPKDGYNSGGYEWCINNWGTKWNAYEENLKEGRNMLTYAFTTAWSPPEKVLNKMATMFPKLNFKDTWSEEGGNKGVIELNEIIKVEKTYKGLKPLSAVLKEYEKERKRMRS